jgi:protein-tyrosine phosphatase
VRSTDAEADNIYTQECTIRLLSTYSEPSIHCEVWRLLLIFGADERSIDHYLFERWQEFGKPDAADSRALVRLQEYLRRMSGSSPWIVHGGAGVGRTGTFIALDFLLELLDTGRLTPRAADDSGSTQDSEEDLIKKTVDSLREQRMMMVANEVQYAFLYEVLRNEYVKKYSAEQPIKGKNREVEEGQGGELLLPFR